MLSDFIVAEKGARALELKQKEKVAMKFRLAVLSKSHDELTKEVKALTDELNDIQDAGKENVNTASKLQRGNLASNVPSHQPFATQSQ